MLERRDASSLGKSLHGASMPNIKLDRIDLKILTTLQARGRISNKDLSDLVCLSASPCLIRVKRLEKAGLISRYMAVIDVTKIVDAIHVVSLIYLHDSDLKSSKLLETYLLSLPQTLELYDVNGGCDYVARFCCVGTHDYYEIARYLLEEASLRVKQISSYIVLRALRTFGGYDLQQMTGEVKR
jgi:Lrp/AsnC family leucine-responsive transcriptional regulator